LTIEDPNTIDSELVDAPPPIPLISALLHKPKWEKRLPKLLSISALDARGTSLLLPVEIGTMDTSELHSVEALLDCGATGSLIDRDFVHSKVVVVHRFDLGCIVFLKPSLLTSLPILLSPCYISSMLGHSHTHGKDP